MGRHGRSGIKSAPKTAETRILSNANALAGNPELFLPLCNFKKCGKFFCPINSARRDILRVKSISGDEKKLEKASTHGSDFSKAYAGLLLIGKSGKVPFIATDPNTKAPFVVRGTAKHQLSLAFQNFDDPELRLKAFGKTGCKIYSVGEKLICCGKSNAAPDGFGQSAAEKLELKLRNDGARAILECGCGDYVLSMRLPDAGLEILLCEKCASETENTLGMLIDMISGISAGEFKIEIKIRPECASKCMSCIYENANFGSVIAPYSARAITDSALLKGAQKIIDECAAGSGKAHFTIGRKCLGSDWRAFLELLNPDEVQRKALGSVLPKWKKPLSLAEPNAAKAIEALWSEFSEWMAEAVGGELPKTLAHPDKIIHDIQKQAERAKILEKYPKYWKLPELASLADSISRTYKAEGVEAASSAAVSWPVRDTKAKSLVYGFLLAIGNAGHTEWKYSVEEKEFGAILKDNAKALLDSRPDEYDRLLRSLVALTGSNETIQTP